MSSLSSSVSTAVGSHPTASEEGNSSQHNQHEHTTSIELNDLKKIEEQVQEKICITVNTHNEEQTKIADEENDDDDACSDADSIVVHFARRFVTRPLTLSSIKPQQEQYRMSRAQTPQTPNDKRISFAQPQKPTVESIFSKTTAKSGKSTVSSVTFRIPTCCGIIELNLVRVLSLFGMLINIVAFIVVAVIVGNAFKLDAKKETSLLIQRSQFLELHSDIDCIVRKACITGDKKLVTEYNQKQANASAILIKLGDTLPVDIITKTGFNYKNPQYVKLNNGVMEYVASGDLLSAVAARKSFLYFIYDAYTTYFLTYIKGEIVTLSNTKQEYLKMASAVNMALVLFGVVVSVPIVILIFALALTTEVVTARKLHRAANIMIMETIASERYNSQFRAFCEKENYLDLFTLLDNCNSYKDLCERAHHLRDIIQEKRKSTKLATIEEIEQVEELERNKYEIAFKIFTEFIDVNGETPFKSSTILQERVKTRLDEFISSSTLEEDLFDEIQRDACQKMVEPFMKFKQEVKQHKKRNKLQ